MQINWIDRAIGYVAPQRAEKRIAARARIERISRVRNLYEAASLGRRTQGWRAISTDVNSENRLALARLRDASREMVRNNPFAARAKAVIPHNAVGAGIMGRVKAERQKRVEDIKKLLVRHFDTRDIDADGRLNLYGLQSLVMATVVEAGEVLVRRRIRRPTDGYALPFQIQVLEADFIDTNVEGPQPNGNFAVQGIEFDLRGKRVAYFLFDNHPGSSTTGSRSSTRSQRVSADFIAHIYRVDRPGQVRGVSWFAPVMVRMRDLADYTDAQLVRQKIAACFAAFITAEEGFDSGDPEGTTAGPGAYPIESFEPGMIERLRQGESVTFASPPSTADFAPYQSATLHEIASGLSVPYEALTGDLTNVSFISGRLGRIEFRSSVDSWRWNMLIPQMLDPLAAWTQEAAAVATGSSEPFTLGWTPPRWEMLDPAAEIESAAKAIRSGLSWQSEELRLQGYDPDEAFAGMKADFDKLDALGLVLDIDPRKVTTRGVAQKSADPNAPDPADK
jgi:lambda family phage portal protein